MGSLGLKIKIGSLDRKITIREATDTRTSSGAVQSSWSDVATVFANVDSNAAGSERFIMEKETSFDRKFFTIRYREDIDEKMIIIYKTKEYDIKSINEVDGTRERFLKIQAEKRE